MTLHSYLKQFKNIAWYPSAYKDTLSIACLSPKSLLSLGVKKEDVPDCFLFTDYLTYTENANEHFFLDDEFELEIPFNYQGVEYKATAFNVKEIDHLKNKFDSNMVAFSSDRHYGRVFTMDVLIEHPVIGRHITKVVYVIYENTMFAFDFLIRNNIKVKYVIHSRYGHGFGGGVSNGAFLCNILKELGTKYYVSDINDHYRHDVAERYLSNEQLNRIVVLKRITDFAFKYFWKGYDDTILYEVIGFKEKENELNRFIVK